jgi:predicted PurR-regulated permease PerM
MAEPSRGRGLAAAGAAAWRLLGIGALVVATWWLARRVMPVLLPGAVAILLCALMRPLAGRLERAGVPRGIAATASVAVLVVAVAGALALIVPPFVARVSALTDNLEQGIRQVAYTVAHEVAGVSRSRTDAAVDSLLDSVREHRGRVAGEVLTGATVVATALGGIVLVLFLTFFLIKDGNRMWRWLLALAPADRRDALDGFGRRAYTGLGSYIRGICFVATVDAVFIGAALLLMGVPLALPLIVLTWVAAFFPIVGALIAGVAAVLVALVAHGLGAAIIIAAMVIVVQQLEGNVLYPMVVGPRMNLHPAVVLVSVTLGGALAGVPGAFLAVPIAIVCAAALEPRTSAGEPGNGRLSLHSSVRKGARPPTR